MITHLLIACSILMLTAAAPYVGEKLTSPKNQYTVLSKLKEGSFSEIFEVQDQMGQSHALKWYKNSKHADGPGFFYLFGDMNREFTIGTALDHPAIIKATDKHKDRYLILELAKGEPLCKLKKNSLTSPQAVYVSLQLIDALKYAFCHQYSNLNLQSENVLLNESLEVKIVDLAYFTSFSELKKHFKIEGSDTELEFVFLKHFNLLTELCIQIFDKVPLDRNDRIDKRMAIKKVIWELIEDFEEKKKIQFEDQFDLLSEVINSFI